MADTASTDKPGITGIVHTHNRTDVLDRTLGSLRWVDELIVADMQSDDETLGIARRHDARIVTMDSSPRVDGVRNRVIEVATQPWVLVLDSDEWLADDAEPGIIELLAKHGDRFDAFSLPRYNYVGDQRMLGTPWYPDNQIRLFRRGTVRWPDAVHQPPDVTTGWSRLKELRPPGCLHIHHRNYRDLRDFVCRQLEYALNDRYDDDPARFDFGAYAARAHENLALRRSPEEDGDLSEALAMIMAWDSVIRGLIHWEALDRKPPLEAVQCLPVASARIPRWRIFVRRWAGARLPWLYLFRTTRRVGLSVLRRLRGR